MKTVLLRVETELDPSAAPRVFGYLGGLGHIPARATLRRDGSHALVMEVQFESTVPAAQLISAKIEQMPFVLQSRLAGENSTSGSTPQEPAAPSGLSENVAEGGMQHAPAFSLPRSPRVDISALCFAAAQRSRAIAHRSQVRWNA